MAAHGHGDYRGVGLRVTLSVWPDEARLASLVDEVGANILDLVLIVADRLHQAIQVPNQVISGSNLNVVHHGQTPPPPRIRIDVPPLVVLNFHASLAASDGVATR